MTQHQRAARWAVVEPRVGRHRWQNRRRRPAAGLEARAEQGRNVIVTVSLHIGRQLPHQSDETSAGISARGNLDPIAGHCFLDR